jgi:ParB-like chromosome segregation protein Spo0J
MQNILNQSTETIPLNLVQPHPKNPRQGKIPVIKESIINNGFYGSIIVQKSTNYILAGNHRYLAAKEAGYEQIPVTYIDVNDDQATRIMLADNRTSDLGTYDDAVLSELLEGLKESTGTLLATGYDDAALDELIEAFQIPESDAWLESIGELKEGDRQPFQQMTFTLHDSQAEKVKLALDKAKKAGNFSDSLNENRNGNALSAIIENYLNEC